MVNFNGTICESSSVNIENNRGFLFGDAIFETLKVVNQKVLFLEDHYFRLMASLRICRMEIPMNFTMEYFEQQILTLANELQISDSCRIRFTCFRDSEGYYLPNSRNISFVISVQKLENKLYQFSKNFYEVELFKDFHVAKNLLSTLKTTNKMVNVVGSVFANENDFDTCLLINEDKNVIEALHSNIFMKTGNTIITPPISDGCINGIIRKQIISILKSDDDIEFFEKSISPFDLQKADELFLTNIIIGIQPITKYRKKEYSIDFAASVLGKLNALI